MKDYKSRPRPKGKKPSRKAKKSQRMAGNVRAGKDTAGKGTAGKEGLLTGFRQLQIPETGRDKRGRPELPGAPFRLRLPGIAPLIRIAFMLSLIWLTAGLIAGSIALWQSPLAEVSFSGNDRLSASELVAAGGLTAGMALGSVEPFELARRLAAHPRVRSANVRRLYPGRLSIEIRERTPALRVRFAEGGSALIDSDGIVLSRSPPGEPENPGGGDLPLLTGLRGFPAVGEALTDPVLQRGREALRTLRELEYFQGKPMQIDAGDPLFLFIRVPGGQRLQIPPGMVSEALTVYKKIFQAAPGLFEGVEVLDFSPLTPGGGGRLILR